VIDLHCHYPMHLLARTPGRAVSHCIARVVRRPSTGRARAAMMFIAAHLLNNRRWWTSWRVDFSGLEEGRVSVALSVLYQPFDELDAKPRSWPQSRYVEDVAGQLADVESDLARIDPDCRRHVIIRSVRDLDDARSTGRVGFIHCVEGGFHLGSTEGEVDRNVARLAELGVRYVTLAHLVWRHVASGVPVIPLLPSSVYDRYLSAPPDVGLRELGPAAIRAMYRERILVDVSHMRQDALNETFALVEELDRVHGLPPHEYPVIASHSAFRFGAREYNLTPDTIRRIAQRNGVVGLILSERPMLDGLCDQPRTFAESMDVIARHIDAIHGVTKSYDHIAIGTDLDGFAKPTLPGLDRAKDMACLRDELARRYPVDAGKILEDNALRVLRAVLPRSTAIPTR
jgi:microsomal dipeptidase-like Zn-dependent dipeptidase